MTSMNLRKSSVSCVLLLLLVVLTFYIASERRELAYYAPGAVFSFPVKSQTTTTQAVNNGLDYISPKTQIVLSRNYSTFSWTSQKYLSTDPTPRNDMLNLIVTYKEKNKGTPENLSRTYANRTLEHQQKYTSEIKQRISSNKDLPPEQMERLDRIRRTCSNNDLLLHNGYYGHNSTRYYYSTKYNFSYCKVPKSGSTFWTQVFGILKYGVKVSDILFARKRARVHGSMRSFKVNFLSNSRTHSSSILVSRDPFSRLYSAFIDKSYLLLNIATNFRIRRFRQMVHNKQCPTDISFQDFLDFIIHSARQKQTLNRHWAPIYSLCRPCDVNAYILVKQESFAIDTELALQMLGVENSKLEVIKSALHDHQVETTVPGVIETVYDRLKHGKHRACIGGKNIALRLWTSFKIQGYLKETLKFPSQMFTNKVQYDNVTYVTQIILNSINRHQMTSLEMRTQRHRALTDAYNEIKEETIDGIREVFKIDFEMFGYSNDPPVNLQR